MPPEVGSLKRGSLAASITPQWQQPLLWLALAWAVSIALHAADWVAMVGQWWDSSTYNHILLVPGILAWLVWQRAPELAKLSPQAWWPGLALIAGAQFLWLLGDISATATASQLGAVLSLQAATVALLGPRVAWALLFPIAYATFLVPLGDELVPALQMITAEITIALTQASGVPAMIEGVFIDTPAGLFEVAEACSGVKFLIAMIALGTLIAHVCFRSWKRRAIFMAVAVTLPIIANGIRAWGTIYIAQSQGIEFAAGFDHVFYGWIFFALVMATLLAIGWKFFDRSTSDSFIDGERLAAADWPMPLERFSGAALHVLLSVLAMVTVFSAWSASARGVEAELPPVIDLPAVPGWERSVIEQSYPWQPGMQGADHRLIGAYRNAQGQVVDVTFALYAAQDEGREAGAFGQGALPLDSEWRWLSAADAPEGGQGDRLQALGQHQRVAQTWFRHGDWTGSSRAQLKLLNMRDRLRGIPVPTSMLIISAEDTASQDAEAALADFRQSTAEIGEWMDAVAGLD
ncbi:exosortase A [Aurantiacibacter sp. MUD11]|uniref:exosortase A n=1 Tax=Aurantiacibacter sp. MUD11 TaxID=3003265 RepID=UPI0022AB1461|nr:exosortase A [Aurantiacibacter sp. MUD11]WAT18497.1 exosortase A [Aurantiacibacter sp. MUD11]